jgi:hypothetical protein
MRLTTVRPSIRNMLVTILGLFICFMVIPSSSFADPFWSIGISGGNGGINGFTLSIGDYGGIPVYIEQSGYPCGHAYDYYDDHLRRDWRRNDFRDGDIPHHMNRPNGYQRNDYRQNQYRQNPHVQSYNRPDTYQQNGSRQKQYSQSLSRPNQNIQNFNRPNGYQQNGSIQNQPRQNIDRQKREKQHKWEMSMMSKSMTFPR